MSDRLAELRRQRALVEEHLAWLEREIANAQSASSTSRASSPPRGITDAPGFVVEVNTLPGETPPVSRIPKPAAAANVRATMPPAAVPLPQVPGLTEDYRVDPAVVKTDVRKGCLLYLAAAFVFLGLLIGILYLTLTRPT